MNVQELLAKAYAQWCTDQGVENLHPDVLTALIGSRFTPEQAKWLSTFTDLFNQSRPT